MLMKPQTKTEILRHKDIKSAVFVRHAKGKNSEILHIVKINVSAFIIENSWNTENNA